MLALQRKVGNTALLGIMRRMQETEEATEDAGSSVNRALKQSGAPIDEHTRASMEGRFGADFGDVRLHVDRSSTELLSARAYTVGRDIVLHPDRSGDSGEGIERTLAHELTHVLQQRRGPVEGRRVGAGLRVSDPNDRFEQEAERTAEAVTAAPSSSPAADRGVARIPNQTVARSTEPGFVAQREGGTSVRDRVKFFQEGKSAPEPSKKTLAGTGGTASFQVALEMFQRLEGKGRGKTPPGSDAPSTGPSPDRIADPPTSDGVPGLVEENVQVESPQAEPPKSEPTLESGARPLEESESLGGKSFRGKRLDPHYKPTEKANYDPSTGMAKAEWAGSEGRLVKYLSDEQRKDYELKLQKGSNLFFWRGEPLDTAQMARASTFEGRSGSGRVIFVMAVDGSIYLANEGQEARLGNQENDGKKWRFNHSSFIRGKKVAGAGELWFEAGKLKGVSDNSGHYKPGLQEMVQVLRRFEQAGVDISTIAVDRRVGDSLTKGQAKTEVLDGKTLLELGQTKLVAGDLEALDLKSSKESHLAPASLLLEQASERGTGVDLAPAIVRVLKLAKDVANTLSKDLAKERPSRKDCSSWAGDLWQAFRKIDGIDDRWISVEGYNAADELAEELEDMRDTDHGDRDYSIARSKIATIVQELSSTPAPVDVSKLGPIQDDKTKTKARMLDRLGYIVGDAEKVLDHLKNDGAFFEAEAFFKDHRTEFAPAIRSAAVRKDVSLDWVIARIGELASDSESRAAGLRMLELLKPGAGQELMNDDLRGEVGKAATKFVSYLESFFDGGDIRDVAFDFARKLVDEDGNAIHVRQVALDDVLKKRGESGSPISDTASFISKVLLPGGKACEDDVPEDAVRIYLAINSLQPYTIDEDDIDQVRDRI